MSKKKIIDLAQYRNKKTQTMDQSEPLKNTDLSLEDKLQEFIHRPFSTPGSINELLTIYEAEQIKKETEDNKE